MVTRNCGVPVDADRAARVASNGDLSPRYQRHRLHRASRVEPDDGLVTGDADRRRGPFQSCLAQDQQFQLTQRRTWLDTDLSR